MKSEQKVAKTSADATPPLRLPRGREVDKKRMGVLVRASITSSDACKG
jgi:hypothetical protein